MNRLEYTRAELRHLEQEFLREREHVAELERRVEVMRDRENILDQEAADLELRVGVAEQRLKTLKERAQASAASAQGQSDAELAELDVHLRALLDEAEKLLREIETRRAPPAPPASGGAPDKG